MKNQRLESNAEAEVSQISEHIQHNLWLLTTLPDVEDIMSIIVDIELVMIAAPSYR